MEADSELFACFLSLSLFVSQLVDLCLDEWLMCRVRVVSAGGGDF